MQTSEIKNIISKLLLLGLAAVISFAVSELIIGQIVHYPKYGVAYKVKYRKGNIWSNIRKPHARLYNVEGKTIAQFNNLGIAGIDVKSTNNPIAVVGSSYVEALQFPPEIISTSLFQGELDRHKMAHNVLNIGCAEHDPYDSWFRLKLYEKILKFRTNDVILVLNSDNAVKFARQPKPLDFSLGSDFNIRNTGWKTNLGIKLCNASALLSVYARGSSKKNADETETELNRKNGKIKEANPTDYFKEGISKDMLSCLEAYHNSYKNFMLVSIAPDKQYNHLLSEYCKQHGIGFAAKPLGEAKYKINGEGHLNEVGNKELGKLLFDVYVHQHS